MAAKKTPPPTFGTQLAGLVVRLVTQGRWLVVVLLFIGVLGVAWSLAWQRVRDRVLADESYQVAARDIRLTPSPPWIHSDVKTEVLRDASLDGKLSLLDDDLTKRLSSAFSLHPWVAKVHRVSKHHPSRVEVDLTYRQPVAMVEVTGGLLPIDGEGVLLPSEDFSPNEAKKYPRVARIESLPAGSVGSPWGDNHVLGAARIARVIGDRWHAFRLYRIQAPVRIGTAADVDAYTFELTTHAGTRILWGRPPGNEPTGEPSALEKIARLEQIVQNEGTLDGPAGHRTLDLRLPPQPPMRAANSRPPAKSPR
jgi:hypothetical protein